MLYISKVTVFIGLLYISMSLAAVPELLLTVQPSYPEQAWVDCIEGSVTLEFTVSDKGNITDIDVLESQPAGVFELSARHALLDWKFLPKQSATEKWPRLIQAFIFELPLADKERCDRLAKPIDLTPDTDCRKEIQATLYTFSLMRNSSKVSNGEEVWKALQKLISSGKSNALTDCELLNKIIVFSQQTNLWDKDEA